MTGRIILRTLAYFSAFSYPLTVFEIYKWQLVESGEEALSYRQILLALQECSERICSKNGLYALMIPGHMPIDEQIDRRAERYLAAAEKHEKLRRVIQYLKRIPHVKAIALCNSLVFHHARPEGDIDLFLISEEGAIWRTRFLAVLPFILLRQRSGEAKRHPVDMSFFVDEAHLDLSSLRLDEADPYFAAWVQGLVPLHDPERLIDDLRSQNTWAAAKHPKAHIPKRAPFYRNKIIPRMTLPRISEGLTEMIQERRFPDDIALEANKSTCIVVRDGVLKFHKNDRREAVRDHLQKTMELCS